MYAIRSYYERVEQPSGVRLIPHREDGAPGFDVIHPSSLTFDQDKRRWLVRQKDGTDLEVTPGDGTWLLYTPYGSKRPWARGAWRSLSRWWMLKEFGRDDWGVITSYSIHYTKLYELGEFLVDTALEAILDADVVVWLVDASEPPQAEDRLVAEAIQQAQADAAKYGDPPRPRSRPSRPRSRTRRAPA